MKREPVMAAASVPAVVTTGITFLQAMGWLRLTADQQSALMLFLGALLPILAALWARGKVTPT